MRNKIISFIAGILVGIVLMFGFNTLFRDDGNKLGAPLDRISGIENGERPDISNMTEEQITEMKAKRQAMMGQ